MADVTVSRQAQRLCIYIGEGDRWGGKPLYIALLETCKAQGLAGATVLRGVAGFGARSRIHTATILRPSEDLPLRIEVIDAPERIAAALEYIAPMVGEGLITVEEIRVVEPVRRNLTPLPADRPVAEVMTRTVITLSPEMPVAQAWERMLAHLIKAMPVVDRLGRPVGLLTDQDLLSRVGLQQRLAVAERLDAELLEEELARLRQSSLVVADVMSSPVITAQAREPLAVAAARMVEHKIKRLPVVDGEGKLVGMLARVDILRQVTGAEAEKQSLPAPAAASRTVGDVMLPLHSVIRHDADLMTIATAFVQANSRRLVVIDDAGRAIGLLNDGDVVTRVQPQQRRGVLSALSRRAPMPPSPVTARDLMSPGVFAAPPDLPLTEAVRRMLSADRKWLVVVDELDRPLGLVDRQIALRAVAAGFPPAS